jgi:plastocyanin
LASEVPERMVDHMITKTGTDDHRHPTTDRPHDGPTRWSDLAALGFLMVAAGAVLMVAAVLIWGLDSDDLAFFIAQVVLGALAAWLVRRPRTWTKVVAIVLGLATGMMMFWTMFGVTAPASFFDFMPALLVVPGVLIGLVAGIASIRSKRSGAVHSAGERRAVQGIVVALGCFAAVSAVVSVTSRDTVSDEDADSADFVVDLEDFEFEQASYDATGDTTILVKNSDPFLHTFTVDELGIDVTLNGGSEKLVTIPAQPGSYVVYCEPHTNDKDDPAEDDMAATLNVG